MILVPSSINSGFPHTGGFSVHIAKSTPGMVQPVLPFEGLNVN